MPAPGVVPRRASAAAVLLLAALLPLRASALEGQVIHIADGDTLTVLDDQHRSYKIRLAGIDAPERGQPFGGRAAEALSALAKNRRVSVSGGKTDRYQRRVGIVRVASAECASCAPSVDVGLSLISAGFAWHYRAYEGAQSRRDRDQYRQAEAGARSRQDGLWADSMPTPPWDWRRARRDGHAAGR